MPIDHPVTRHLAVALDGFRGMDALARHGTRLSWGGADGPDSSPRAPKDQVARAEIIGPEAPLQHPAFRLGFLLMAPRANCLMPGGPAVDVQHLVSGQAFWTTGETADERRPGDFILLPSNAPFAVRTGEEPLLTIYIRTEAHSAPVCC
jgi:Dimethlysulfonioproprionate lyase